MYDDMFVIDAVVHPYNMDPSNYVGSRGQWVFNTTYSGLHQWNPEHLRLSAELYQRDQSPEMLTETMFKESSVDLAVNHALSMFGWMKDGAVSKEKNIEFAERWPDRWILYAGVDPTRGTEQCLADLEDQHQKLGHRLTGLKMYPAEPDTTYDGLAYSWRLDDERLMFPIYERCLEYGLKSVAVHKAAPLGPITMAPYRVDDVDVAAGRFPELNFEIVHAGYAFLEETAQAIARFPNVYANLETTFMLSFVAPGMFERIIATLAYWGGYEKLLFSSGTTYSHPQYQLDTFREFKYSDRTLNDFGLKQITKDDKARILGLNFADMVGLDIESAKGKIADDEFSQYQRDHGMDPAWTNFKALDPEAAEKPIPKFAHNSHRMAAS